MYGGAAIAASPSWAGWPTAATTSSTFTDQPVCEPISLSTALLIGGTALEVGSTVSNHVAQGKAAKANKGAALQEMRLNQYDAGVRQQEELKAATQAKTEGARQGLSARAQLRSSAAEAGVTGNSVDMLEGDMVRDEAAYLRSIEDNTEVTLDQLQRVKMGASANAQNRINQVQKPSLLGTAAQVGSTIYGSYERLRLRRPASGS